MFSPGAEMSGHVEVSVDRPRELKSDTTPSRVPGPEHHFLINPYGMLFCEITASSLVKVDLEGRKVAEAEISA